MFELLFSASGCVGRAVYWIVGILTVMVDVVLMAIGFLIISHAANAAGGSTLAHAYPNLQALTPAQQAAIRSVTVELCIVGGFLLLTIWVSFAIEIKRWHDRGMSGFWVLLRFVSAFLQFYSVRNHPTPEGALTVWAIILVIYLFQLIQLGFLPGVETSPPQGSRRYSTGAAVRPGGYPSRGYTPPPPPPPSSGMGTFALGFLCALFLAGAVCAAYYLGYGSAPNLASLRSNLAVPAATPAPPPVADSLPKTYGKDWVIADGERLNGITHVAASPGMQVTILYSNGGKNLPASSLPQAFLTQWGITPDVLEAANQPKTNP